MRLRLSICLCLLPACVTTRFLPLDKAYAPTKLAMDPRFLAAASAPEGYRTVGVLEVFHSNTTRLSAIRDAARDEGRKLGCELLLYEPAPAPSDAPREGVELVFGGPQSGLGPPQSSDDNRARFLCAVSPPRD